MTGTPRQRAAVERLFPEETNDGQQCLGVIPVFGPKGAGERELQEMVRQIQDACDLQGTLGGLQREVRAIRKELQGSRSAPPAVDEETARRLFALVKELHAETRARKAPVIEVFRLYCLEGLTRKQVARACRCSKALVTLRLRAIETKLGRKAAALRQLSGHFEQMEESLRDDRARRIRRTSALDQPEEDQWDA